MIEILTHQSAERLDGEPKDEYRVLPSPEIRFRGQFVAVVVADSPEAAREAAELVEVAYERRAHDAVLRIDHPELYAPQQVNAGSFRVRIGAVDLGTGTWTALAQVAADALAVSMDRVELQIGDTSLPHASVAGGSSGITTWGTAICDAAANLIDAHGHRPDAGAHASGRAEPNEAAARYAMHAFGAQFVEVAVDGDTGEIAVTRALGVFAAGRIVNPRTARSQLLGGMTMGISTALMEQSTTDPVTGHYVNHDLAGYHIAACADIRDLQVQWIEEDDPHVNPMGTKGIGEIGIVGTAAAVANAVHNATGIRIRDLPITPDRLLRAGL